MEATAYSEITDYLHNNLYYVKIDLRNVTIWHSQKYRHVSRYDKCSSFL